MPRRPTPERGLSTFNAVGGKEGDIPRLQRVLVCEIGRPGLRFRFARERGVIHLSRTHTRRRRGNPGLVTGPDGVLQHSAPPGGPTLQPLAEMIRRSAGIRSPPFTSTRSPTTTSSAFMLIFSPLRMTRACFGSRRQFTPLPQIKMGVSTKVLSKQEKPSYPVTPNSRRLHV